MVNDDQSWSRRLVRHESSARPWLPGAVGVLALGVAWGALCRLGDLSPPALRGFFNIAGPWALVAFASGASARTLPRGGAYGALGLATGVAGYYGVMRFAEGQASGGYLLRFGLSWLVIAVVAGACFGAAGAGWRGAQRGLGVAAVALLGGVLLGEGLQLLWRDFLLARAIAGGTPLLGREYDSARALAPAVEALLGILLPALLLRRRQDAVVGTALASALAILALGAGWLLLTALRAFLA